MALLQVVGKNKKINSKMKFTYTITGKKTLKQLRNDVRDGGSDSFKLTLTKGFREVMW